MSADIEAAGALATASLAAREIEGKSGERGEVSHGACANCGASLSGRYCHACGQSAHIHRTLSHVFEEFLHGVLHFDAKAWRTLPLLVARPGTLTHDYIHGKRVRYISPLALFLFMIFLMFFVFALIGGIGDELSARPSLIDLQSRAETANEEMIRAQVALEKARTEVAAAPDGAARDLAQRMLDQADEAVAGVRAEQSSANELLAQAQSRQHELSVAQSHIEQQRADALARGETDKAAILGEKLAALRKAQETGSPSPRVDVVQQPNGDTQVEVDLSRSDGSSRETIFEAIKRHNAEGRIEVNTGSPALNAKIRTKLENPELAWYKIQNAAYKFSFLLVPISLPFLAFLFLFKRNVTLYDHSVFLLYSLSFMSLLFILVAIAGKIGGAAESLASGAVLLAPPLHMFFQLRGAYGLSWFSALWRTSVLLLFCAIALSLFLVAIIVLGLTA